MSRRIVAAASIALAALGCGGGCRGRSSTPFDPAAGYEPLEPCAAPFPAATSADPHPEAIETVAGAAAGHDYAHGAGYLHVPLSTVWQALQDPLVSRIHGPDIAVTPGVETEYPLSFDIRYEDGPWYARVDWTIRYRGGPLGAAHPPAEYGLRYQKIDGTDYVSIQSGSLVATDAGDSVTAVQLVCWLNAYGQGPENVRGTVTDWWSDIVAKVQSLPP